ncbi:HNH endonuclease [Sphingomonas sp. 28-63-12]|uniref:HNH endonuclease n=1 Tax=Sphingomonas sp. 28-63-12 TaxID=1970434 RepID=UPI000BD39851|nr:MAG: restriction endonuclease [Sphingomonas sp. 28-63-12]
MGKGVFIHREDSNYKDTPTERYHFPRPYLARARECVGDWIIYYEPVKVRSSRGYWAVARVETIIADPAEAGMYYALIAPGSFLKFPEPVPFGDLSTMPERGLLNEQGRLSGRAQSAVRPISDTDFARIVNQGLNDIDDLLPRLDDDVLPSLVREERSAFDFGDRDRASILTNRIVRDRAFRKTILRAYDERCALTGLKLINGGGRAEVEAAHIRPVESNGPDDVTNGLALSGTIHWMFDRGLISLADDLSILVSRQVNDQDSVWALLNKSRQAMRPARESDRPHPHFLTWHRDHCFKQ